MDEIVKKIASIYFHIDAQLQVSSSSPVLKRYLPNIDGQQLLEQMRVHKPTRVQTFAAIAKRTEKLFLLIALDNSIAIRGQFIQLQDQPDRLTFVGAPWAAWISDNKSDADLHFNEFSALDSQLDQLMLLSTQRQNMTELEELTTNLQAATQEADNARRAQADFFAVMSHEMRTPLNGIATSLKLMHSNTLSDEDFKLWRIAEKSASNLESVVDHVLNYSKLRAGGFENSPVDFDVRESVEGVTMMLSPKAAIVGTQIDSDISNAIPVTIKADEAKFRQVLINLVGNAVKFTQEGRVTIQIGIGATRQSLRVEVNDTGVGIDPQLQEKIFNPYWTYDNKDSNTKGTGLGLKISREFVSVIGGELQCASELGKGSSFFFEFPFEAAEDLVKKPSTDQLAHYQGHVLLAEDNPTNQYLASALLERRGITVSIANNGLEAIQLAAKTSFDLILMDISMPKMGGIVATKHLREVDSNADLPIVALTAHSDSKDIEKFIASGMNQVLIKPIDVKKLDACLAQYLLNTNADNPAPKQLHHDAQDVFDLALAEKLTHEIGTTGYTSVAKLFLQELAEKTPLIDRKFSQYDYTAAAKLAHSIHSSATTLGCAKLGTSLKQLETSIKNDQVEAARQLHLGLANLADASQQALQQHLQTI